MASSSRSLLLIDSRVPDIEGIISGLMEGVDHLIFDYSLDTYESLKTKISQSYECVGIAQHNVKWMTYPFLGTCLKAPILCKAHIDESSFAPFNYDEMGNMVDTTPTIAPMDGLAIADPELESWSDWIDFAKWLQTERSMQYLDLLACDLWSNQNWVYAIKKMREVHGIYIRASVNITGEGGDYILESDNLNLVGLYFTESILQYPYAFGPADSYTITPSTYAYGSSGNVSIAYSSSNVVDGTRYILNNGATVLANVVYNAATSVSTLYPSASQAITLPHLTDSTKILNFQPYDTSYSILNSADGTLSQKITLIGGAPYRTFFAGGAVDRVRNISYFVNNRYGTAQLYKMTDYTGAYTSVYQSTVNLETFWAIDVDSQGNVFMATGNSQIYKYNYSTGTTSVFFNGTGIPSAYSGKGFTAIAIDGSDNIYVAYPNFGDIYKFLPNGTLVGIVATINNSAFVQNNFHFAMVCNKMTNTLYVCNFYNVYSVSIGTYATTLLFNTTSSTWNSMCLDASYNKLYIIDSNGKYYSYTISNSNPTLTYNISKTAIPVGTNTLQLYGNLTTTATNINNSNLVMLYPFDVDTRNHASGIGITDASLSGSVALNNSDSKLYTMSLYFPGNSSSKFSVKNVTFGTSGFTISMWYRVLDTTNSTTSYARLFEFAPSNNNGFCVSYQNNVLGLSLFGVSAGSTTGIISSLSYTIADTNWHLYTFTLANASPYTFTAYVDNVQKGAISYGYPYTTANAYTLYLCGTYNSGVNYPVAFVSNFVMYNRVLNSTERGYLMNPQTTTFNALSSGTSTYAAFGSPMTLTVAQGGTTPNISRIDSAYQSLNVYFTPSTGGNPAITTYYYSVDGGAYVNANTTTSPLTISNLLTPVSRSIQIMGYSLDASGNVVWNTSASNSVSQTPYAPGSAPTITSISPSSTSITVNFTAGATAGYPLLTTYYYSLNGGAYVNANVSASPIVVSNLTLGTNYAVSVKSACDVSGSSIWTSSASNSVSTYTDIAPGAPTIDSITIGDKQLSVAFTAPADNGGSAITTYKYSLNGGAFVNASSTSSPIVITGLTNGTSYTVALKAYNTLDGTASATSVAYIPDILPNSPTITSIIAGHKKLSVYFTAPVDNGSSAYTCKYSVNGGALTTFDKTVSPLVLTGLTNGTAYTVSMVSVNQLGTSTPASTSTQTPAPQVPDAVVVSSAQVLASTTAGVYGKVAIAFSTPASNDDGGITGYALSINGVSSSIGLVSSPYIATVAPGSSYNFQMTAINAVGTSAASNTVSLTPVFVPENPVITGVDISSNKVSINVTAGNNGGSVLTAYEYSLNNGTSFVSTTNLSSPIVVSGITNGTLCSIILRAINAVGKSGYSNMVQATPISVPDTPTVQVTAGIKSVTIAVTEGSNQGSAVSHYAYSLDNGSNYVLINPTSPIVVSDLSSNVSVSVKVYCVNSAGNSIPTSATTVIPYDYPSSPSGVSATAGNQQLSLTYTAGSGNGRDITAYQYSLDAGATYTTVAANSFVSPYVISGLTNGTTYTVRLRAVNLAGNSADVSSNSVVPYGVPLNVRITGVSIANGGASVYVTCNKNGRNISTYLYSFDGVNYIDSLSATSPIALSYLNNGTSYTITVKAVNEAGTSAESQMVSFMPYTPQSAPSAPTIDSVVSGDKTLTVNFTEGINTGSPITGYKYTLDGSNYLWAAQQSSPLIIDKLTNDQSYSVSIKAVNGTGDSSASNSVSGTPLGAPGVPVILTTTTNAAILSATYSVPLNGNAASAILLQYRLTTVSTGAHLDSDVISTGGTFTLSGVQLSDGVKYQLQLRASVSGVATPSEWSTAVVVYPPPTPVMSSYNQMDKSVSVTFSNVIDLSNVMGFKYKMDSADYQWMDYIPNPTYTFTGLTNRSYNRNPNKTYSLKFKTVNFKGEESAEIGPYTFSAYGPPELPTFLSISAGNTWLIVKTQMGDAGGPNQPVCDYTLDGGNTYRTSDTYPDASGIFNINLYPLTNRTTYSFMYRARTGIGASAWSQVYTGTPLGRPWTQTIKGVTTNGTTAYIAVDQLFNNNPSLTCFNRPDLFINGPGNVAAYQCSLDGGNTYSYMPNVVSPLTLYGLTNGNTYSVKVKVISTYQQESLPSNSYTFTVSSVPDALSVVSVTPGDQSLQVVVLPGSNGGSAITQYQYSLNAGNTFTQANTVALASSQIGMTIPGLSNGTNYSISVRAVNANGNSIATPVLVPAAPVGTPSAPTITDVSFVAGIAYVYFTAASTNGAGTIINYKYTFDSGSTFKYTAGNTSPLAITGLSYGTTYPVQIASYTNSSITGTWSNSRSFSSVAAPDTPVVTSISPGDQSIVLTFIAGSSNGSAITGYEYSLDGTTYVSKSTTVLANGQLSMTISGLTNGTSYNVRICAVNAIGASVASPVSSAITPYGTPTAPVITDISCVGQVVYVSFTAGSANGSGTIIAYKYTVDSGATYKYAAGNTSPLAIRGLDYGSTYALQLVSCTSQGGQSSLSNSKSFLFVSVPDAPTVTSLVAGDQSITVTFLPGNNNGGTGVSYAYSLDGTNFTTATTTNGSGNKLIMVIGGLTNGTAYNVQIRQSTSAGNSSATPVSAAYTPIGTPAAPTVTDVSCVSGIVYVSFTAGAVNGPGSVATYKYTLDNGSSFKYATGSSSPVTIRGLEYGIPLSIKLAALTTQGMQSGWSNAVDFTSTSVPEIPAITSIVPGDQSIAFEFVPGASNGSSITGYEYSLDGTTYQSVSTTSISGGKLRGTISGLANGTAYSFQLRANNAVGNSSATLVSQSYTPIGTPAAPTITDVVCQPGTAYVHFTAGSVNGPGSVATYKYSLDSGVSYKFAEGHASPLILRDLSDGVSYTVQIVAYTTTGLQSSASNAYEFNTSGVPGAPTIVSAVPGNGLILLTITPGSSNGGAITGYEYSLNGSTTFTAVSATNGGTSITISGLTNGESYSATIRAVNAVGRSELSLPSAIVIPFTVAAATQIVRVEPENNALRVVLSNTALDSLLENNYTITGYQYALDGETFNGEVSVQNSAAEFVISGLTNGSFYTIAAKAITSAGLTGKSNVVSDTKPYTVPDAPTIVSVVPSSKKAVITFTAGAENGSPILGYRYRINGSGEIYTALTTSSPITVYGLENKQEYTVELYAVNAAGLSQASAASSSFIPFDVPYAPVVTDVIPGNGCAYVYFNEIDANGSPVIALRYSLGAAAIDVSGLTSPLTIPGLLNKTTYQVAILAVNVAGQSAASNSKQVIVGTPTAPVITSVVPGPKTLTINFTAPNDNGSALTGYMWAERGTTKYNKFVAMTSPAACLGLTNGQSYDIVIYAVNKNGMSVASNSLGGKIPFDIPSKPVIVSVVPQLNSAVLTFTAPPSNGSPITKYQYALNSDTVFTDLSGLSSPVTITGLPNNVNYTIKMIAINAAGASVVSPSSKAVMYKYLPPAQIKVTTLTAGFNRLTVNFTAPVENGAPVTTYLYAINGSTTFIDASSTRIPLVITDGIQNNTNYNISVIAVNSAGQSIPSVPLAKPVSFVWLPPLAPTITNVVTGNQSATVSFTAPATRGPAITGYSYSFDNGTTNYDLSGQLTSPFTIEGLVNDTSYNLTIAAMSSVGYSVRSAAKGFKPVYKAPDAPVIGTILSQNTALSVNFTAGAANGSPITGYKYTFNSGNTFVDAGTDKSPILITGLTNGTSYSIRLVATNALGDSPMSVAKAAAPKA